MRERAKMVKAPQKRQVRTLGKRLKDDKGKKMLAVMPDSLKPEMLAGGPANAAKKRHATS
jgi:hypothetical protein